MNIYSIYISSKKWEWVQQNLDIQIWVSRYSYFRFKSIEIVILSILIFDFESLEIQNQISKCCCSKSGDDVMQEEKYRVQKTSPRPFH